MEVIHTTYGDSWRISDASSLFTYSGDETTESFTDLSFPSQIVRLDDFSESELETAEAECRSGGVIGDEVAAACTYDLLISGDDSFAEAAQDIVAVNGVTTAALNIPVSYTHLTLPTNREV